MKHQAIDLESEYDTRLQIKLADIVYAHHEGQDVKVWEGKPVGELRIVFFEVVDLDKFRAAVEQIKGER